MQTPAEFARHHLSEIVPDYLVYKGGMGITNKGKFSELVELCVPFKGAYLAARYAAEIVAQIIAGEDVSPIVSFLPQTKDDYVVEFQYPNGGKISVLIPKKMSDEVLAETPYGLNLVFGGHYE